jgi:hypothetical protein
MATARGMVALAHIVAVMWMVRVAQAWSWCWKEGMGGSKYRLSPLRDANRWSGM